MSPTLKISLMSLRGRGEEAEDEDEEIDESADSGPVARGNWKATSTYNIYMVYTPNAINNGCGDDDDNDGEGDGTNVNNNGPKSPPPDVSQHEGIPTVSSVPIMRIFATNHLASRAVTEVDSC